MGVNVPVKREQFSEMVHQETVGHHQEVIDGYSKLFKPFLKKVIENEKYSKFCFETNCRTNSQRKDLQFAYMKMVA